MFFLEGDKIFSSLFRKKR